MLQLALLAACSVCFGQGPVRERLTLVLQREDGRPLGSSARVHLFGPMAELPQTAAEPASDEAGVVSLRSVPAGSCDVWVEPADPTVAAALVRGLEVTVGADAQELTVKLPAAGSVAGTLLLADGKTPAAGYGVSVQTGTVPEASDDLAGYARGALTCYAQATAAPDGSFALGSLAPGTLTLDVRRPGERRAWSSIDDLQVVGGQTTQAGSITLPAEGWEYLFAGGSLDGWREGDFLGRRPVQLEGERVVMPMGEDMTGITCTKAVPKVDYEVTLQGVRVAGSDFYCGLTFPVGDTFCSLILGGWGGSVVGLSSLDYADASENETTRWLQFRNGRWYRIRVRVLVDRIAAWLDGEKIVDVSIADRRVSTRIEVEPSKPFGISTWRTTGAARDIRLRRLTAGR